MIKLCVCVDCAVFAVVRRGLYRVGIERIELSNDISPINTSYDFLQYQVFVRKIRELSRYAVLHFSLLCPPPPPPPPAILPPPRSDQEDGHLEAAEHYLLAAQAISIHEALQG